MWKYTYKQSCQMMPQMGTGFPYLLYFEMTTTGKTNIQYIHPTILSHIPLLLTYRPLCSQAMLPGDTWSQIYSIHQTKLQTSPYTRGTLLILSQRCGYMAVILFYAAG